MKINIKCKKCGKDLIQVHHLTKFCDDCRQEIYNEKKLKPYPYIVCQTCGSKASKGKQFDCSTWYQHKCDVCGEVKDCTESRDFFYPKFKGHTYVRVPNPFDFI